MGRRTPGALIDIFTLESPFATDIRRVLHQITRAGKEQEVKTVLFTSATTGEGKSTLTALSAITAARKGKRVLIVDSDLRRPVQHTLFQLPREQGVVEGILEGGQLRSFVKKTKLDKLDLLTSGRMTSAPAEVFDAARIVELLEELKFYYDLILIDCAPLLPVSDPMMLAPDVDGVVMVVKAGETDRELVKRGVQILKSADARIIGVVLNNMKRALPHYYNYEYYDGGYY
ncbi:MAG: tyrosine-protein kinase family protein, partial [Candidatus Zixiibacteriota bacterium]